METRRDIRLTPYFDEFFHALDDKIKEKYKYVLQIVRTQYVVNEKFVKHLESTPFYELRVPVASNQYRTIIVAIDANSFMQATKILLLNSFLKKSTKQYKAEIEKANTIFNEWRTEYAED